MTDLPDEMTAAVLQGPGRVSIEAVPTPAVGSEDVLVAVDLCGICGSDLHFVLEGWARPGTWQGHEWVGTVAAAGSSVERWSVGDAVVGGPRRACGKCPGCRAGRPALCRRRDDPGATEGAGAFATYKRVHQDELLALPEGLDPRAAALAEPLAVALHAINRGVVDADTRVLVMGAGPIGALAIAVLRSWNITTIACVEPNPARAALAERLGATSVRRPEDLDVPSIAEPSRVVDDAVDVVLECSGKASAMEAGLAQLDWGGTLVLVGAGIEPPRLDPNRVLLDELIVTGAFEYDAGGFEAALHLLASGVLPVDDLLEPQVVGLDGLIDAMRGLADGRLTGKVLVQP